MYLKIQGLVLRRTEYNDHDVLLTILSKEHGKITAKARGLKRKNSPLTAQCQLLAFAEFTLFEYRGMYTINEASTIELFHDLRRDLGKLSLGTYFAQAAEVISQEDLRGIHQKSDEVLSSLEQEVLAAYLDGKSYQEIADMLGISETTSRTQLSRARIWLQNKIKERENV